MLVSEKKKRENIAEYIIYMWQLEDIIRAHEFDAARVHDFIMGNAGLDPEVSERAFHWYQNLCSKVQRLESGEHLDDVVETLQELNLLHGMLLTSMKDADYMKQFEQARPAIEELKEKGGGKAVGEIEACFNGVYGVFLLNLQKKEISAATKEALIPIQELLRTLSLRYAEMKRGDLKFSLN